MSLLGERLRKARETRGLSPLQVEIDTRIRATVIQALEEGDFENLPPEPFLRGLIRTYSTYLGVDSEEMLNLYIADFTPPAPPPPTHVAISKKASVPPPQTPPSKTPGQPSVPLVPKPAPPSHPTPPPPISSPEPVAIARKMPIPSKPPETLPPPEKLTPSSSASEPDHVSLAHMTRRPAPFYLIILLGIVATLICLIAAYFAASAVTPMIASVLMPSPTATRPLPTRTPTPQPGAQPTNVPTLGATAPPFATFPGNPTATLGITPRRTLETFSGLNVEVTEVTQTITVQIGADGVTVFNGQIPPGTTRSWQARETLYVRVENIRGATLMFNGSSKPFGLRTFAERNVMERQWTLNDKGVPIITTPIPPAPQAATATPPVTKTPLAKASPAGTPIAAPAALVSNATGTPIAETTHIEALAQTTPPVPTPTLTPFLSAQNPTD